MKRATQPSHPRAVPIVSSQELAAEPDTPFAEGSNDQLDPDLRHRLISERAFARYCERGYADGCDIDDWLDAEAEVDHVTVLPRAVA